MRKSEDDIAGEVGRSGDSPTLDDEPTNASVRRAKLYDLGTKTKRTASGVRTMDRTGIRTREPHKRDAREIRTRKMNENTDDIASTLKWHFQA
jgi:hypothetical protein